MKHTIILTMWTVGAVLVVAYGVSVALKDISATSAKHLELAKQDKFDGCMSVHESAGFISGPIDDPTRKLLPIYCGTLAGIRVE